MTSLRWSHRSVLTPLPFTRTTNNYLRTGYTEGIPELESKAEAAPVPQRPRTTGLYHMGKSSGWTLTAWVLPSPAQHHTRRSNQSLQALQWAASAHRWQPVSQQVGGSVGAPTLVLPHRNQGGMCGSITGHLMEMEKWEGLLVTSTQALKDWIPTFRAQIGVPTSNSAHLQSGERHSLTGEFGRVQICLVRVPNGGVLLALEPGLCMPRWKSWAIPLLAAERGSWPLLTRNPVWENLGVTQNGPSQSCPGRGQKYSPTFCRHGPQPQLTRRAGKNTCKLCYPATREPGGRQAELIILRAEQVAQFGQGSWGTVSLSQGHNKEHSWNEKEDITNDTTEIQRTIRGHYEQLYTNNLRNLT